MDDKVILGCYVVSSGKWRGNSPDKLRDSIEKCECGVCVLVTNSYCNLCDVNLCSF